MAGKRRRRGRKYLLLTLILAGAWVLWGPAFRLQTVEVRGTDVLNDDHVIAAAGLRSGTHLFAVRPDKLARDIVDRWLVLDSVAVTRAVPGRLVIAVQEARPVAWMKTEAGGSLIGERCVVLGPVPVWGSSLPQLVADGLPLRVDIGSELPGEVRSALRVAGAAKSMNLGDFSLVVQRGDGTVELVSKDDLTIIVGRVDDSLSERLSVIPYILDDIALSGLVVEYVDVSSGQPVIKTASEEECEGDGESGGDDE